jgi:hypothetical protein
MGKTPTLVTPKTVAEGAAALADGAVLVSGPGRLTCWRRDVAARDTGEYNRQESIAWQP